MGAIIAILSNRDENAQKTALEMLRVFRDRNFERVGIASVNTIKIEKSVDALQSKNIDSPILIGCAFSRVFSCDKPQPLRLENVSLVFDGRIYPAATEISDAEIAAKKLLGENEKNAETFIGAVQGDFAFAIVEKEKLIIGRDPVGVRPLYYGENVDFKAFASEKKALWKIGIENADSFPPGHIAVVDKESFRLKKVKSLAYSEAKPITTQAATQELQKLLQKSIKERTVGLKEFGVAFSGGLDSSIIAFIARKLHLNAQLIHVSLKNRPETEDAKRIAEELQLPLHVALYSEKSVEETLPQVLWLIEEPDPLKVAVGIPFYWVAEKTAEIDFQVLLAGQGADEYFGGYKRYVDTYLQQGAENLQRAMFQDITRLYETNLERDAKICNFHNVELRLPFATYQIAKFVTQLPIKAKIEKQGKGLRKLVLRRVAKNLGLPRLVVEKPKKAIQYATGVNQVFRKLSQRKGLNVKQYLADEFRKVYEKMSRA